MAGQFGTWQVAEDAHVSVGNIDVDIPAGEFTPGTVEEHEAVLVLARTSLKREGDETAFVMATFSEFPDEPAPVAVEAPAEPAPVEEPPPAPAEEPPAEPAPTA